jgi:hypothetical protein
MIAGMTTVVRLASAASLLLALSCGDGDSVSSEEEARLAYLGLDRAVERALNLGMQGYNAASSANISPQTGNGDVTGTLVVSGQVDQGMSNNKEMRLRTAFTMYEDRFPGADAGAGDESDIVYDTATGDGGTADLPALDLSLRNIPAGTFTGTFTGSVRMSGELDGDVTLALTLSGQIRSAGGDDLERVPGTTRVTGTATSRYGVYTVDVTR